MTVVVVDTPLPTPRFSEQYLLVASGEFVNRLKSTDIIGRFAVGRVDSHPPVVLHDAAGKGAVVDGLAGLTAGRRLSENGFDAVVPEARTGSEGDILREPSVRVQFYVPTTTMLGCGRDSVAYGARSPAGERN